MARYRINPNAICSSKNYKQSKKLHMDMLKRNHEVFMEMVIKEEIVIKRQAYIKVFDTLIAITPGEVARFEKKMTIIWK
jgi:hypothetical protein|nr:MAG TPA: hypothetical protein [Crassvirales sp.]